MTREREFHGLPGIPVLITLLAVNAGLGWALTATIRAGDAVAIVLVSMGLTLAVFLMVGHFMVHPNQGQVLQLFGQFRAPPSCRGCAGPIHC